MFKRITVALVGLFAALGLAFTPASGATATAGDVTLFERVGFDAGGAVEVVQEVDIPSSCASIPESLPSLRSLRNDSSGPGTIVAVFASADSNCDGDRLATIQPGGSNSNIQDPANPAQGAGHWMAVTG